MSDLPADLDLKFLPDWLKEGPAENRYAHYQGEPEGRGDRDRGRGPSRGGPGGGPRGDRGDRREGRGPGGPRKPGGDNRGPRRDGPGKPGDRPRGGERRGDRPHGRDDRREERPRPAPPQPVPVKIDFLPTEAGAVGIARQIKSSARAYPLFGTARLFLEKPERHRVRITSIDPSRPLYQIDDGPVSFDLPSLERNAFRQFQSEYYREEVLQGEPIKGNYTNVARSRSTGALLGPTNFHAYQPALRRLFEERFSRRMSFIEFQREEIEIVSDEQTIADWKEQARSTTTYVTLKEAEPITFKSAFEAEQHFRKTYLPQLIKTGTTLETSGHASRASGDRNISAGLRDAWERERGFPQNLVNHLRPHFVEAGLHFFKHRKRILFISAIRPQRHDQGQVMSEGISAILSAVEAQPRITRPQLAAKLLGESHDSPDLAAKKAALAADLHYLIHVGQVIEFHDGALDLPLGPKAENEPSEQQPQQQPAQSSKPKSQKPATGSQSQPAAQPAVEAAPAATEPEIVSAAHPVFDTAEAIAPEIEPEPEAVQSAEIIAAEPGVAPEPVATIEALAAPAGAAQPPLETPSISDQPAPDHSLTAPDPATTLAAPAPANE